MGNRARFKTTVKETNNVPDYLRGCVGVVKDSRAINELTDEYEYLFEYVREGQTIEEWIDGEDLIIE